jgi:drug/metabolite transporter (DMT)-like permease
VSKNPWTWIWLAAVGFAIGFPLMKAMFESGMDIWQILVPRYVIGTVIIAFIARSRSFDWRLPDARRQGMVLGVVNVAVPTILMSIGTDLLPSSVAGVLTAFIPTATVAAAHLVVPGERFSVRRVPGLILATTGVAVLVLGGSGDDGARVSLLGVAVFLAGVLLAGVGGAFNRRFAMGTPATALVLPQFVAASAVVGLIGLPLGGSQLGGLSTTQWVQVVGFGLVGTALPFFSLLKASELASAAKASLIGYIVPLLAALMSVAFLGDPLSAALLVGGGLIVAGVLAADRAEKRIVLPI